MGEDLRQKAGQVFSRAPEAPIGPDGKPFRTSVCQDIDESVKKAAMIEEQLRDAKVI